MISPVPYDRSFPAPIPISAIELGTACAWVLAGLFLSVGVVGHDPWKPDEGYVFGVILDSLRSGQWTIPTLAGEPFLEKPPLYYILGSLCARLAQPWLALHDGARLASLLSNGITLAFVGLSAQRVWGRGAAATGALLFAGSLGFVLVARTMLPDLSMLSGVAIAFLGLLRLRDEGRSPGLLFGTGCGIAFLSKGLVGPGMLTLAAAYVVVRAPASDRPQLLRTLGLAALAALPWCAVWPALLLHADPAAFHTWFWDNNIGRFTGTSVDKLGAAAPPGFWWHTLPWYALPALPLAALALASHVEPCDASAITACLAAVGGMVIVLLLSASARENYALPLLVPIAVLGVGGLRALGDVAERRIAALVLGLFATAALWLVALWLFRDSAAPFVPGSALLARHVPVAMDFADSRWMQLLGLTATLAAVAVLALTCARRALHWLPMAWLTGVTLVLGIAYTLWLPWLEASKSYRAPIVSMQSTLPTGFDCMASEALGESERAMLEYVAGIRTTRREAQPDAACSLLLVQMRTAADAAVPTPPGWVEMWRGRRAAERYDEFRLLRRASPSASPALGHHALPVHRARIRRGSHMRRTA
ncbi:MAG: glycosyltransferase family 39 protein [Burkholderiales bacterium]|nr:glycosyltransferase family 39 protein [Burkholderiales bacterium]